MDTVGSMACVGLRGIARTARRGKALEKHGMAQRGMALAWEWERAWAWARAASMGSSTTWPGRTTQPGGLETREETDGARGAGREGR